MAPTGDERPKQGSIISTHIGNGTWQEGELRPQLLDRFGLSVSVATMQDTKLRTQMVLDRLAYDDVRLSLRAGLMSMHFMENADLLDL